MEEFKRLIRSILISSPLELEVWKLDKDYEEINGESIPYQSFGFKSLEDLLRSIPDVVEVYGTGRQAKLRVIVSSKSAHIDKLVSKQKISEPRRRSRRANNCPKPQRRTAAPRHSIGYPHQASSAYPGYPQAHTAPTQPFNFGCSPQGYVPPLRYNIPLNFVPLPRYDQPPRYIPPPQHNLPPQNNLPPPYKTCNSSRRNVPPRYNLRSSNTLSPPQAASSPLPIANSKIQDKPVPNGETTQNEYSPKVSPRVMNGLKPEISSPLIESPNFSGPSNNHGAIPKQKIGLTLSPQESNDDCYYSDQDCCLSEEEQDCQELCAEDEYINYNVPFAVQENLKILISKYTEGLWCADIPNIYLKMFKKPLYYTEYGYRSLIQMCMALEKIFRCHRPDDGDFLLFDKNKPMPDNLLTTLQCAASFKSKKVDYKSIEEPTEPAIIEAEEIVKAYQVDKYPIGVMELGDEIPRQFLSDDVKEEEFIDVVVGEVYDPSKFWILLKEHAAALDFLMDEMQVFYTSMKDNLQIPQHMLKVGLYCAAPYNNEYHRAVIVTNPFNNREKIKVFYGDYGTLATINCVGLLFLHRQFMKLPLQAIRARLASIWPPIAHSFWPTEASSRFLSLVKAKDLVAQAFRIDRKEQTLDIFLVDTSTEEDIYMNDTLVSEGYALFTNQEQQKEPFPLGFVPKFKYLHLYPTFDELENGKAPSAAEVIRLCKLGFQYEYVFSNYYEKVDDEKLVALDQQEDQFVTRQNQLLTAQGNAEQDNDDKCNTNTEIATPNTHDDSVLKSDWRELCDEKPEPALNERDFRDMNMSSILEEPAPSPLFSPSHKIFAKPTMKPPPGFEGVTPDFNFSTGGNVGNTSANVSSYNVLWIPNRTNKLPPSMLPTVLAQKLNVRSQQYQNQLLNPQLQNSIMQQNPLVVPEQQALWDMQPNSSMCQQNNFNPLINQQCPPSISFILDSQRQQLQSFVQKHLAGGNKDLINHLGNMLQSAWDRRKGALFKIVCDVISNKATSVLLCELDVVVNDLLNLLDDYQILDLASSLLKKHEEQAKTNVTASSGLVNDTLANSLAQTSLVSETATVSNNTQHLNNCQDTGVQTDVEIENKRNESRKKLVVQTALQDRPVHVICFQNGLYVPVNDILQFTIMKHSIDKIRKLVMMSHSMSSITDIRLHEHEDLAEELSRYKIYDATVHVVPAEFVPEIIEILGSNDNNNYKEFFKTICSDDLWLSS